MADNLMLDPRCQMALHTGSQDEKPLCGKTLQRFRNRCADRLEQTGEYLIRDCMTKLAGHIAGLMGLSGQRRRMDSLMIAVNIKRLDRMQLTCACVGNFVKRDKKLRPEIPEKQQGCLEAGGCNRVLCYGGSDKNAGELKVILQAARGFLACPNERHIASEEHVLLKRCMEEQTIPDGESSVLRLRTKEDGGMHSGMLRNPADPVATCRRKAGREHRVCAVNVDETAGENGSFVTDYQVEANNCSDSQFLQNALERTESVDPDHPVLMAADGDYGSEENEALAAEKNVELVTIDPGGQKPDPVFADFIFPEDGQTVPECPAGHSPRKCGKPDWNGQMILSSGRSLCAECLHRRQCKARATKRSAACVSHFQSTGVRGTSPPGTHRNSKTSPDSGTGWK